MKYMKLYKKQQKSYILTSFKFFVTFELRLVSALLRNDPENVEKL